MITNTQNKAHKRKQHTWASPGDLYRNQINYILVKTRYRNQVLKTIGYPATDIDFDHNLLMMTCKLTKPKKDFREFKNKEDGVPKT